MPNSQERKADENYFCEPTWFPTEVCEVRDRNRCAPRVRVTREYLQDREIKAIKRALLSANKKIESLLMLVDAEDIQAMAELKKTTPPTSVLLEMGREWGRPPGLPDDPDERPW